ncbi:hypothetical protein [Yersinia similis]|nr:hypothetical protein [Yersinia similis]
MKLNSSGLAGWNLMLSNLFKLDRTQRQLRINQFNVFYNYVIGFESANIDLVKTAANLLKTGISNSVFFSDFKCIYMDDSKKIQIDLLKPEGRQWDSSWEIKFNPKIPERIIAELIDSYEIAFHESRVSLNSDIYIRTSLPPLVLEYESEQVALFPSVKVYKNGIAILSFQFDETWEKMKESDFISNVVNIYQRYFKSIWVDAKIQTLDAEVELIHAFEDTFSFGGNYFRGRVVNKLINKMKKDSQKVLDDALQTDGEIFSLGGSDWSLHRIAGTENNDSWEATLDLCRSMYCNAIGNILVLDGKYKRDSFKEFIWQGRPSVSLLRFDTQSKSKKELFHTFSHSMMKILLRTDVAEKVPVLPQDLRMFEDYCFHANRSILLWTWLKPNGSLDNVWDEPNTRSKIFESQARAEQIEYYNMSIARACSWAHDPQSDKHLLHAYETLANSEKLIHHSSCSGEVSDSLSYIIESFGTTALIPSAKEVARYHLDELRYKSDFVRSRRDRWLTFVFGLVGAATLAEFVVHPIIQKIFPMLNKTIAPMFSFFISGFLILSVAIIILVINRDE